MEVMGGIRATGVQRVERSYRTLISVMLPSAEHNFAALLLWLEVEREAWGGGASSSAGWAREVMFKCSNLRLSNEQVHNWVNLFSSLLWLLRMTALWFRSTWQHVSVNYNMHGQILRLSIFFLRWKAWSCICTWVKEVSALKALHKSSSREGWRGTALL